MIPQCPAEPPAKQAGAQFPAWRQPRAPAAPHHTSRGRLPPTVWTQTRARVLETCRQEPREGVSCSPGPGPTRGCQAWRVERKSGSSDRAHEGQCDKLRIFSRPAGGGCVGTLPRTLCVPITPPTGPSWAQGSWEPRGQAPCLVTRCGGGGGGASLGGCQI